MNIKAICKYQILFFIISFLLVVMISCDSVDKQKEIESKQVSAAHHKNLNVTILLDLSDRISIKKNPDQHKKDIKFINNVLDAFKSYLSQKGVVESEDKIKLIFYPLSMDELYQDIADSLNIEFGKYDFGYRKIIYENISSIYNRQLHKLYSVASYSKVYTGSDLFNYFKHRVVDDCILPDSSYINLLIILTDGYIYDKNSVYQQDNKFSYLIPEAPHVRIFRKLNNWEEHYEKNNYGLIPLNNDLSAVSILVGEVHPVEYSPKDFDILKKYWSEWLEKQKVRNYKIIKSDINTLNRDIIFNFISQLTSN